MTLRTTRTSEGKAETHQTAVHVLRAPPTPAPRVIPELTWPFRLGFFVCLFLFFWQSSMQEAQRPKPHNCPLTRQVDSHLGHRSPDKKRAHKNGSLCASFLWVLIPSSWSLNDIIPGQGCVLAKLTTLELISGVESLCKGREK